MLYASTSNLYTVSNIVGSITLRVPNSSANVVVPPSNWNAWNDTVPVMLPDGCNVSPCGNLELDPDFNLYCNGTPEDAMASIVIVDTSPLLMVATLVGFCHCMSVSMAPITLTV